MASGLSGSQVDRVRRPERPEDQAPKFVVQLRDVQQPDVPGIHDGQLGEPRHLVHAPEHAPVGGLRELYVVGNKIAECVRREPFGVEGILDQRDDESTEWSKVIRTHVRGKDREQRARVGDEEALASLDPDQVRVEVARRTPPPRC